MKKQIFLIFFLVCFVSLSASEGNSHKRSLDQNNQQERHVRSRNLDDQYQQFLAESQLDHQITQRANQSLDRQRLVDACLERERVRQEAMVRRGERFREARQVKNPSFYTLPAA